MTQESGQTKTLAPLRNVNRLLTLVKRLENRGDGVPGMGCFYGWSGLGKSMAASYCTNAHAAIHVEVKSVWSKNSLCEAILEELGLPAKGTAAKMASQIAEALAMEQVPLIIDEADFLVDKGMIEIVRDIYQMSDVPVILVGEELLPQKLRRWERVHGRIRSWVSAEAADDADFDLLMNIRCPGIVIEATLTEAIKTASIGSARRIVVNLDEVREIAAITGKKTITMADWGDRDFFTGQAPDPRSGRSA